MTSNVNNYWTISYTSAKPERAMQVLNELYSNPEVSSTLIYGVQGKNWDFVDEEQGLIDYPEGVTAETTDWFVTAWHFPNELISYKWVTDGPTIWDDPIEFNKNAHPSQAKGFFWDSTPVVNEVTACNAVLDKYRDGLDCGVTDPDEVWDAMKEEFEAAGIQKILDEKQSQLDAWREANGK